MIEPKTIDRCFCDKSNCSFRHMVHGHYELTGDPIPLNRPRMGRGRLFDGQKQQRLVTGITFTQQHKDKPLFEGPLLMIIEFYVAYPVHASKAQRKELYLKPVDKKPDLSNLIKYIEDVATSILYKDDCTITTIKAAKRYNEEAKTIITIVQEVLYEKS